MIDPAFIVLTGTVLSGVIVKYLEYHLRRAKTVVEPKALEADYHAIKTMEIENFGEQWWKDFGTECKCEKCTYVYSDGNMNQPQKPRHEIREIDGWKFKLPPMVPAGAYLMIEHDSVMRYGYAIGQLKWTDKTTGRPMSMRITPMNLFERREAVPRPESGIKLQVPKYNRNLEKEIVKVRDEYLNNSRILDTNVGRGVRSSPRPPEFETERYKR